MEQFKLVFEDIPERLHQPTDLEIFETQCQVIIDFISTSLQQITLTVIITILLTIALLKR